MTANGGKRAIPSETLSSIGCETLGTQPDETMRVALTKKSRFAVQGKHNTRIWLFCSRGVQSHKTLKTQFLLLPASLPILLLARNPQQHLQHQKAAKPPRTSLILRKKSFQSFLHLDLCVVSPNQLKIMPPHNLKSLQRRCKK